MPPSTMSVTCTGFDQCSPPSVERTTMIWSSNSLALSHAAECCWFMKPMTMSPFGSTPPYEKKLSSQAPGGPAGPWFAVQNVGFEPEMSIGRDHDFPALSEYETMIGERRNAPLLNSSLSYVT